MSFQNTLCNLEVSIKNLRPCNLTPLFLLNPFSFPSYLIKHKNWTGFDQIAKG